MRNKNKSEKGFTLIELLVVVAIIALLTSIALISLMSARQKSRDAKRLSDMVQSNTALELYWSTNKGYPSTTGVPTPLVPGYASSLPAAPNPPDGGCDLIDLHTYNANIPANTMANGYYYYPSGTVYVGSNNVQVVPDFVYYFCVGFKTGEVNPGLHMVTPKGLR